ncbi:hypothetical protein [Pontibacter cellulosilyticus]|uniref:DUF3221 domain-containing protein n=1 Tax=Pontibacter cellulosilyticus TaxID=1720253 RepID=A0A923N4D9_9BACT|nr:hypothetical protein [Pontibacter cellulosilyticus]MBC5991954.1 hypothetical protein [Pontibacter cellulosilyticus]
MALKHIQKILIPILLLGVMWLSSCQTGSTPAGTATEENKSMGPERVDIRGSIIASRYSDGQVVLEIEGIPPAPGSRYDRAYVLVLPTAQIIDLTGGVISYNELRQGQNVAILLRSGGQGNRVGVGVARKIWIEDAY